MSPTRTVSIRLLSPFQRVYTQLGVGMQEQLDGVERLGISVEALADPDTRIPLDVVLDTLERSARMLGRADLGLLAGQAAMPGDFGLVELAARACSTAGEAFRVLAHAYELLSDGVHLSFEPLGDRVSLRLSTPPDLTLPAMAVEFALSALWSIGRTYIGVPILPLRVRFAHSAVPHAQACAQAFGCPVQFDALEHAIDLPLTTLTAPMATASPLTANLLRSRVDEHVATRGADNLLERMEQAILRDLSKGLPSLAQVKDRLGVSERTLHRRLKQAGTSYRELCDAVRLRIAVRYLEQTDTPLKQIASSLGYRDVHAFHRAFKRLAGVTPQQRRSEHRSGAAPRGRTA